MMWVTSCPRFCFSSISLPLQQRVGESYKPTWAQGLRLSGKWNIVADARNGWKKNNCACACARARAVAPKPECGVCKQTLDPFLHVHVVFQLHANPILILFAVVCSTRQAHLTAASAISQFPWWLLVLGISSFAECIKKKKKATQALKLPCVLQPLTTNKAVTLIAK